MTKVKIDPGVCGLITAVEAESEDGMEVTLKVKSGCESIRKMFEELGDTFDAYELCLGKPGTGPLYELRYRRGGPHRLPGGRPCEGHLRQRFHPGRV